MQEVAVAGIYDFHLRTNCRLPNTMAMASALLPYTPINVDTVLRPNQAHPTLHMIAVDRCANWFDVIRRGYGVPAV